MPPISVRNRILATLRLAKLNSSCVNVAFARTRFKSSAIISFVHMVMEDAVGMPSMPECHAMAGTMDEQDPQLCRAHCDGDSLSSPSLQGLDLQALAAHAIWVAYVLPVILDSESPIDPRAVYAELDSRAGSPPIYLTHQVFRN